MPNVLGVSDFILKTITRNEYKTYKPNTDDLYHILIHKAIRHKYQTYSID
jgi:hypothetical protein